MPSSDELAEQFVSTFEELHYLLGGVAAGFLAGLVVALRWFRHYREVSRRAE